MKYYSIVYQLSHAFSTTKNGTRSFYDKVTPQNMLALSQSMQLNYVAADNTASGDVVAAQGLSYYE